MPCVYVFTVVTSGAGTYIAELIGVAVPIIDPTAAGLPLIPTADGSSDLGTRSSLQSGKSITLVT